MRGEGKGKRRKADTLCYIQSPHFRCSLLHELDIGCEGTKHNYQQFYCACVFLARFALKNICFGGRFYVQQEIHEKRKLVLVYANCCILYTALNKMLSITSKWEMLEKCNLFFFTSKRKRMGQRFASLYYLVLTYRYIKQHRS